MQYRRIAVIMAGGSGERFWPLSQPHYPKLFLRLTCESQTLLDQTITNISPFISKENIFLATAVHLSDIVKKNYPQILPENIILEPIQRNTAGCIILTTAYMLARYGGDGSTITMAVLPGDHHIKNPEQFRLAMEMTLTVAEKENALVTLGINPTRPETGYGYLEIHPQTNRNSFPVHKVLRFHEKPDSITAERYLSSGNFLWNSGIFIWRVSTFLDELGRVNPDMRNAVSLMTQALINNDKETIQNIFQKLPAVSIDYVLMEKASSILTVRAEFGWDDIGSWDALDRIFPHDKKGNVVIGNPVLLDTQNTIVYNEGGEHNTSVAVIGIENLIVVITNDGVLVVPKDRAQDVRKAVDELKNRHSPHI
jgi:mannose-1-phosphate guanylyltransferase